MSQSILYLNGKKVDLRNPPSAQHVVKWSKGCSNGEPFIGSFRTVAHMDQMNSNAFKKFGVGITPIQGPYQSRPELGGGADASAGTHDFDAAKDWHIPGVPWWTQQRFGRANGDGCWYRHAPAFGNHIHGFTLPPHLGGRFSDDFRQGGFKVGKYIDGGWSLYGREVTSSQIDDYYHRAYGLSGQHTPGCDHSWFPPNIGATIFSLHKYILEHR